MRNSGNDKIKFPPYTLQQREKTKFVDSLLCIYIVSVLGGCNAEIVTFPFDLVKTRLQIQGEKIAKSELEKAPSQGMISTALEIVTKEGFYKLWRGVGTQFIRHSIYSGTRVLVYKSLKENVVAPPPGQDLAVWKASLCGIFSGGLGQFLSNPAELAKIQIQMEGKRRILGLPSRVDGIFDAFRKVYRSGGFFGFWKGGVPNTTRSALVSVGDLSGYDVSKRALLRYTGMEDNFILHTVSSLMAGFAATCLGTPADVIKSRVMNQPVDDKGKGVYYKSTTDCLIKTVSNEGLLSLYKGFLPHWIRLGPWAITFWLTYEHLRILIGGKTF